ncbi:conserved hypothetical protein [Cenarchaeum symbiosum A]|uniref:Histidine-specific methyltransferase SAM-dependent domain-containing protein n=1 Tax=Cenarchaeum symbiosum (strain A) TaxID=414004 RepID=A0RUJ1_CENSY|nr:conserved hypothetical protein [Cenarchaeum symbiosum A]
MSSQTAQELGYEIHRLSPRLHCLRPHAAVSGESFARDVAFTLGGSSKSINPKWFYDDEGSALFGQICTVPEYYITVTESSILSRIGGELGSFLARDTRLVELGSGLSSKTRLILDVMEGVQDEMEYLPIDISDVLAESCHGLLDDYPRLEITGIIDTYHGGLEFLSTLDERPNLIAFLGSSLGNFDAGEGELFLKKIASCMGERDMLLLGLDLDKESGVLEAAYDDTQGVTARFNLNVLTRMNRELGANFDLSAFAHRAKYNGSARRIEMYIESLADQDVAIPAAGAAVRFGRGELVHTENSHKYTIPRIREMVREAGLGTDAIWQDEENRYALVLCSKQGRPRRT